MLRTCSRCHSTIDISYFSMSRKKERYKTCDNCRKKPKIPEIKPYMYIEIDKELREEYEKEFDISSRDMTFGFYSLESQVDRYTKMLAFWKKHTPEGNPTEYKDAYSLAKWYYIQDMKNQLLNKIKLIGGEFEKRMLPIILNFE